MHDTELELLARQLAERLRGDHDAFCRELVRLLAYGHPVTREHLATVLQMTAEQVAEVLAGLADLEVDQSGHVVGWGLTFIPTPHRFRVHGHTFYTWCALDALTYPALLRLTARVESSCPVSGTEVSLSVTPTGIHELTLADAVVSIVIPGQGSSCNGDRGSFCNQSRFFRSKRDALMWQGAHPDARILCVEDAYRLGKLVARYRHEDTTEHERT
jgi:alkylmercury lyase